MTDLEQRLQKRLEREKRARREAEDLLEAKARELYQANQGLQAVVTHQEELVRQRTEDLRYALELAETANKHKSFFLANMSHEIRTPLNGIIGLTQLLQSNDLESSQQLSYLDKIKQSANNLLLIVNDILDFSNIDSKHLKLGQAAFDFDSVLKYVYDLNHINANLKGVRFSVKNDCQIPSILVGDATRLTQIINNLVSNAVKFTVQGSVDIETSLIQVWRGKAHFEVKIFDTGVGIAPDQLQHLFDPFIQADVTTSRRYGGTGLGLTITKELLDLMGAEIKVTSELGDGTQVRLQFVLPIASEEERLALSEPKQNSTLIAPDTVAAPRHLQESVSNISAVSLLSQVMELAREGDVLALESIESLKACDQFEEEQIDELHSLINYLENYEFDAAEKQAESLLGYLKDL